MRRISNILVSLALWAGCSAPCDLSYDDLSKWIPDTTTSDNKIEVDPQCNRQVTITLGSTLPAYLGINTVVSPGTATSLEGKFELSCSPTSGKIVSGILEDHSKVDYSINDLVPQTDRSAWTATTGNISYLLGAYTTKFPCTLYIQAKTN